LGKSLLILGEKMFGDLQKYISEQTIKDKSWKGISSNAERHRNAKVQVHKE
jgi:hypothetical protein